MKMGGVSVMKLVLIYSTVINSLSIFTVCSKSMQLNDQKLGGNETDRLALLAVKAQIQHDPNQVTSSWNESLHFCMWLGVTCGGYRHPQRVTKLELDSLALVGSISPHIGNLTFLRVLDLQNNSFTHQIPPQIGQLHRLQVLYLNNNSLNGFIPPNISNCVKLTNLSLAKNNLVGQIPNELGSLSKLLWFNLKSNKLTGEIPPSLGNLSFLNKFSVLFNNLEGTIPSSLCQLKKLYLFYVGVNRLSGNIPSCIYNLSSMVYFDVSFNKFQGSLPSNLNTAFPNLQFFSASVNHFTGAIPQTISNATNLVVLQCSSNKLTGQVPNLKHLREIQVVNIADNLLGGDDLSFVSELINATRLTWLEFAYNNFGGTLPISISNLSSTNLQVLTVARNQLHGSLPIGLGNLVSLQNLIMEGNSFTGSIPTDIGRLSDLGQLDLHNNRFSGSIPTSLGNLTRLILLYLDGNNLNGSIPSSLGNYDMLQELILSGNNLNGHIPAQVFGLSSLSKALALDRNQFSGSLPMEIGNLKNLHLLNVANNLLSGEVPSSLGGCESLEVIYLQRNFFSGHIPSSMKDLGGVRVIDLSRNNLSGDIPQFLQSMSLENLNLSFNQFSGAVPTEGAFRNASVTSVAGNAGLCGGVADLQLPVCKFGGSGGGLSHRMKLVISLVSGFTILGLAVVLLFIFLHKKSNKTKLSTLGNSVWQVSYATLLKATDGFSPANLIGVGAFGFVYRGILTDDRVVVAVKVLNMLHRGSSKSFLAECEALRNIRHRNLVKILTACSSIDFNGNDFKAIVYEFMDNGSLEEWLHPSTTGTEDVTRSPARTSLSLIQRLGIAIDVASALDYLHNHCETPIVHCDLKPSNVLLDGDLTGHVSDFGLSKFLFVSDISASGNQSSSIGIRGSVGYAAPEYGMGGEVSTYGDVYSFGILLLEMFTGKRPTDHMFSDGLNLHNYVKTALPEHASSICESVLLQEGTTNVAKAHRHSRPSMNAQKVEECLSLILEIGVACSVESPTNRKDTSDVASQLQSIRRNLLS